MTSYKTLSEFRAAWLPHISDRGLDRLADLLERGSPLLIHGSFQRNSVAGCLATHIAWHHPRTKHLNEEAGVIWLAHVARLNPATSFVVQDWDRSGHADWELRQGLIALLRDELHRRSIGDVRFDLTPISESAHPCLSA
ncbi:MAG: hypothetical protein U0798_07365 [Gemmataceae bacterium]